MGKRIGLFALGLLALAATDAAATGNIKAGQTIWTTGVSTMDCVWDTTVSVTASTLDTLVAPCWARYAIVQSETASMALGIRLCGAYNIVPVPDASTRSGSGWKVVDTALTVHTVATGELFGAPFGPFPTKLIKGVILDGQSTGSVYIRFEP